MVSVKCGARGVPAAKVWEDEISLEVVGRPELISKSDDGLRPGYVRGKKGSHVPPVQS